MKRTFRYVIALILGVIFLFIYNWVMGFEQSSNLLTSNRNIIDINEIEANLSTNKVQGLQEYYRNTDIKGIISLDGVNNFYYPIAQTSDNDYYLNHDYFKNNDEYGSIMADYRVDLDNSKKILIFGHSSIKKDVPFNQLENYYEEDYYKEHSYITLETETNSYRYEIFSVYVETNDFTYMNLNFDNEEDWYKHILKLQKKSFYSTDVELNYNDIILILQTCSNHPDYQNDSKKYLLIVSRRVQ